MPSIGGDLIVDQVNDDPQAIEDPKGEAIDELYENIVDALKVERPTGNIDNHRLESSYLIQPKQSF